MKINKYLIIKLFCLALIILFPDFVFAADQASPFDAIEEKGDQTIEWLTTTLIVILGTIAIFIMGIAIKFGKMNWTMAATIIAAIVICAKAKTIVEFFVS